MKKCVLAQVVSRPERNPIGGCFVMEVQEDESALRFRISSPFRALVRNERPRVSSEGVESEVAQIPILDLFKLDDGAREACASLRRPCHRLLLGRS